jgi:predicted transcriptional regulator
VKSDSNTPSHPLFSPEGIDPRLARAYTPLEARVLEVLWASGTAQTVADVRRSFASLPYTTVMTALERLFSRGAVSRHKEGRAFVYVPKNSRETCLDILTRSRFMEVLPESAAEARAVMSAFLDALIDRDSTLLDELDAILRDRRLQRSVS